MSDSDPYRFEEESIVNQEKAKEMLEAKGVAIDNIEEDGYIDAGLALGYLTLKKVNEANDYAHGLFELYMLRSNGV